MNDANFLSRYGECTRSIKAMGHLCPVRPQARREIDMVHNTVHASHIANVHRKSNLSKQPWIHCNGNGTES